MSATGDSAGSEPPKRQASAQPGPLKDLVAGGVGGMCLVITGHPLDTIKVCSIVPRGCCIGYS